jgi:PAS domain S-box-containing protein
MLRNLSYFADNFELTEPDEGIVPMERRPASRVLRGESFTDWECHGRRKDTGQEWEFSFSGSPVKDRDGRQVLAVVVTRDVTAARRAGKALRESEARFRTLADSIPQLAWTARPDGYIDWYNRRWYEYTGTTPAQMEGWGWQAIHEPGELPGVMERWRESLATGGPFDMVFPLKGADGRFRPFLTRVLPLRGEDGRVLQWFGTNTDISDIKEMEEALKQANRDKDHFLAMLAHELRNPLAPVRTGLEILKSGRADREAVEKTLAMMERQVRHMTRIVDDLLDVSRLMRGRIELRPERLDLGRFTCTALEDQRPAFATAGLSINEDLPELPVWVSADPTRLTQVIDNLIQNAVKFTDRGGMVSVRVRAEPDCRQAVLTVRDTGVGIEPDLLPRLFETFTQADRSLERSKGGLGLGLSLVKGLVDLHGGTVEVLSEGPGRGAVFVVRLPLQAEPAAVTDIPTSAKCLMKRLRVLVVEDSQDAADSLKLLLEAFGYEVRVAYTGPAGVDAAKEWRPDVVLCDIGLPGLDGYAVARELRRDPSTSHARMIAVTGYGGDQDRERSHQAGFDAHLTKPADPAAIQELLAAS